MKAVFAKLQSVRYLLGQQSMQLLHVYADVIGAYCLVGLSHIKIVGEDNVLHQCYNLLYHLYRR